MSLLRLKDIGKIYVSSSNVSVGIRNVNLSFERNEFVAVTGKSGSGKSTLLNVISGMDTYEEGELFIEENETSYYLQQDWEEYRMKYISFVFQDYNIIDSFTVLENVELALMNITDLKERKAKALELIKRVGLEKHAKHKGSHLSGGQKQRTVIARALAKDSPIILADEPTGNLDSQTGKEIIELLHEVSKDKLVIIVTHNFEQVEQYATRHIRIYDGQVISDDIITKPEKVDKEIKNIEDYDSSRMIKDSFSLGTSIYKAKPRLTFFITFLLCVTIFALFIQLSALKGFLSEVSSTTPIFNHIDGRLVITNTEGTSISSETLEDLKNKTKASSYLKYDSYLDAKETLRYKNESDDYSYLDWFTNDSYYAYYDPSFNNYVGKYPENDDEIFIYGSVMYRNDFKDFLNQTIYFAERPFKLVGYKTYVGKEKSMVYFTHQGFEKYCMSETIEHSSVSVAFYDEDDIIISPNDYYGYVNINEYLEDGEIEVPSLSIKTIDSTKTINKVTIEFYSSFTLLQSYEYDSLHIKEIINPSNVSIGINLSQATIIYNKLIDNNKQSSLFYKDDSEAKKAISYLKENGYICALSSSKPVRSMDDLTLVAILKIFIYISIFADAAFYMLLLFLCLKKSMDASRSDIAIMRSMAIPSKVIKNAFYIRAFFCAIIPIILFVFASLLMLNVPSLNSLINSTKFFDYVVVIVAALLAIYLSTKWHMKRLFSQSVKKAIKG